MKLFCIPFAGASASYYGKWNKYVNSKIQICPIELSGRGTRIKDPLYNDIYEAIEDIYGLLKNQINNGLYAVFGHSMGSLLAYEFLIKYCNEIKPPVHAFVSGGTAPHMRKRKNTTYDLPIEDFKNSILAFDGTQKELFENQQLSKIFIPILRGDIKIIELFDFLEKNKNREIEKLPCPITVLCGKNDHYTDVDIINEWEKYTDYGCEIHKFDGGHFFINDYEKEVVEIINNTLL